MAKPSKYLAVYDVTNDRERYRVAKVLEGFGVRIQKSAFECLLSKGRKTRLQDRVEALSLKSGWVGLYRLDPKTKRLALGKVPASPLDESHYAIIIAPPETPPSSQPALSAAPGKP